MSYKGFEYSEQEKKSIANQLERMLMTEPPANLLEMTEAYFAKSPSKPSQSQKQNPRSRGEELREDEGASVEADVLLRMLIGQVGCAPELL